MNKKIMFGLSIFLFAAPALASVPAFADIDTDDDAAISKREAIMAGISQELFTQLDLDKDNKLNAEEYKALNKNPS